MTLVSTIHAPATCASILVLALSASAQEADPLTTILPREADMMLALSAAPPHLRDAATVHVFTETGYELAREGTNGFVCLTNRDSFFYGSDALKPTCWDRNGSDSYVPVMLDVGDALAAGTPRDRIVADIAAGFASGKYREPEKSGVAYMLAGDVRVDAAGNVTEQLFPGHYMIYAPNVTNEEIGHDREAGRGDAALPFLFSAGAGGAHLAYIIAAPGSGPAHAH